MCGCLAVIINVVSVCVCEEGEIASLSDLLLRPWCCPSCFDVTEQRKKGETGKGDGSDGAAEEEEEMKVRRFSLGLVT